MSHPMLAPADQWAMEQFGDVDLGDHRRNQRALQIAAAIARRPQASIPEQMGDSHQAKAAYRLLDRNDVVTFDALSNPHHQQTRLALAGHCRVLLIGDTTEINYTHHRATRGLEMIGDGKGRGFDLHSVLAVTPQRQVLGMAHQNLFYRQVIGKNETRTQRSERDRQSLVWAQGVREVGAASAGCQFIHINDSASDNWPFYQSCSQIGCDWIVPASQDRRCGLGHDAIQADAHLKTLARSLAPSIGEELKISAQRGREARTAKLLISSAAITLFAPWLARDGSSLKVWVVRVWEVQAPQGAEPLEWILITSLPADQPLQALEVIELYTCRPLIEEYHKCLKTGCAAERRQLKEGDRLEALLGFLAIVAVRLLVLKEQTRNTPQAKAIGHVEPLAVQVLVRAKKLNTPANQLTLYQFWREVAKLGGFLARNNDGEPGWQTTWRGWRQLLTLLEGAQIGQRIREKSG